MIRVSQQLIIPTFLFLCLLLGGSQQSIWGKLVLQIIAVFLIASAAVQTKAESTSVGRALLALLLASLLLLGLQFVPLPPAVWPEFPERRMVEDGYRMIGQPVMWQPISLTPYATLEAFLFLLPPIAIILSGLYIKAYRESWAALALFAGTIAGILLAYLQVTTSQFGRSGWYLYENTNVGSGVGFFANINHMGTLLLMTFPFVVALFFQSESENPQRAMPLAIVGVAAMVVLLLGLALNGSLAAVALAVPVVAASTLLSPKMRRFRAVSGVAAAIALIAALIFLANSPVQPKLTGESTSSFEGRWEIWQRTWQGIENSFPVGTGFGSFEAVYVTLEPAETVTRVYINHAHNDYLELVLEGGLLGVLIIFVFLAWWTRQVIRVFARPRLDSFAGAAAIASGAALAHSAVDYPLRTTAIAATFAFCLATLALGPSRQAKAIPSRPDAKPARHVKLG